MEQQETNKNLRVIASSAFLTGLFSSMMQAVWQPFVLSLGAPMSTLGLLEGLGGGSGLVSALIQPIGGWLADRRGRKLFIALRSAFGLLVVCFCLLAAILHDWRWLVPGVILLGASLIARPAESSLIAESVHISRRGMAYSVQIAAWMIPGVFAPALGGFIAGRWGVVPVFLLRLALEGLQLLIILRFLQETLRAGNGGTTPWHELPGVLARMVVPPKELRGLYWALAIDVFVWGLGSTLLFGMLSQSYGFTTLQLGVMSGLLSGVWALSQLPIGRLVDRYGCKPFLVLSEAMGILLAIGWLFSKSFLAFAILHGYFGLLAATWVPAQQALLANSVPPQQRGEAIGRLSAFRGLCAFPAPYIGGLLYDRFGFQAPILANLLGIPIALVAIAAAVREPLPAEASQLA